MSITDWLSPEKSTAAWGAKVFKGVSGSDWDFARREKEDLFEQVIKARPGTPPEVLAELQIGRIQSLSDLCTMVLAYEAKQINPYDIPNIKGRVRGRLIQKGIPEDLA